MNHYIQGLQESIKNGPRPHTPYSLKTTRAWDEDFRKSCFSQMELYRIGKGRLN